MEGREEVGEGTVSSLRWMVFTVQFLLTSSSLLASEERKILLCQDCLCGGKGEGVVDSGNTHTESQVYFHELGER